MSWSEVALLLAEVQRRGVTLAAKEGRLLFRPRAAVTPDLLAGMSRYKAELIALLSPEGECAFSDPPLGGTDITDKSPDSPLLAVGSVPLGAGARAVPPEVSSEGSDDAPSDPFIARVLEVFSGSTVVGEDEAPWETAPVFGEDHPSPCWACGERQRWRLREDCPWVCPTCHPPQLPADQLEWLQPDAQNGGGAR